MSWVIFEKRMQNPTVAAIQLAEELLQLEVRQGLERLDREIPLMDDVTLRQLARQLKVTQLLSSAPAQETKKLNSARVGSLLKRLEEELAYRIMTRLSTSTTPSKTFEAYTTLMNNIYNVTQSFSPALAAANFNTLKTFLPRIEDLLDLTPVDYLKSDVLELKVDALENMADCLVSLGDNKEAQQYYEQAIRDAESIHLTAKANTCHRKLTEVLYARSGEFDQALSSLLRQWQKMRHQSEASISRVLVALMLGEAYAKIGDSFEAEKMFQHVERDLVKMGYPAPTVPNLEDNLQAWIRTADKNTKGSFDFQWVLLKVFTAYISIAHKRSELAHEASKKKQALGLFHSLTDLSTALNQRWQHIFKTDNAYLAKRTPPQSEESELKSPDEMTFLEDSQYIGERLNALCQRIEDGETSRDILTELNDLETSSRQFGFVDYAVALLDQKAGLLLKWGESQEATKTWRQAVTESVEMGRLEYALYLLERMTDLYFESQNHGALSLICEEAIQLIETTRYNLSPGYQHSEFLQRKILFYQLGVLTAFKLKKHQTMLERMELSKAQGSLRSLVALRAQTDCPNDDSLEKRIRDIHSKLDDADGEQAIFLKQERRLLMDLLSIHRAEARGRDPIEPFSLESVQAALEPDEVVLYYYWLGPQVVLVVGLDSRQLIVDRQIMKEESYSELVRFTDTLDEMDELEMRTLHSFGSVLLPEAVHSMMRGKKRILISPNRFLHMFPFHVLDWKGKYLIEHFAISYIPNLSSLLVDHSVQDAKTVLAIGVEEFVDLEGSLDPLPGAAREVKKLQALYEKRKTPMELLLNQSASVEQVRSWAEEDHLATFRLLHFATHGEDVLTQSENPMETRLFLHDGAIDGLEIANWRLHAELVVLSACDSGKRASKGRLNQKDLAADDMFGLHAAFFNAGARNVIGALWPVDDETTCEIMTSLHHYLSGMTPEYALQAAMLDYLKRPDRTDAIELNPAYWAPFFVTTVGRKLARP